MADRVRSLLTRLFSRGRLACSLLTCPVSQASSSGTIRVAIPAICYPSHRLSSIDLGLDHRLECHKDRTLGKGLSESSIVSLSTCSTCHFLEFHFVWFQIQFHFVRFLINIVCLMLTFYSGSGPCCRKNFRNAPSGTTIIPSPTWPHATNIPCSETDISCVIPVFDGRSKNDGTHSLQPNT